jgi:hypothetical protein
MLDVTNMKSFAPSGKDQWYSEAHCDILLSYIYLLKKEP